MVDFCSVTIIRFVKTVPKGTRGEIQNTVSYTSLVSLVSLFISLVSFYRELFGNPVTPHECTVGPLVSVRGANKTVCSAYTQSKYWHVFVNAPALQQLGQRLVYPLLFGHTPS